MSFSVRVSYDLDVEEVASVIYAMWDDGSMFNGSVENKDDVKENIRKAIREYGVEFADYLSDVSYVDGKTFTDAILQAGRLFRELAKREAVLSELERMDGDTKEKYEDGAKVVRIPASLTPNEEVMFKTFWPGRPSWLSDEDFQNECFILKKEGLDNGSAWTS